MYMATNSTMCVPREEGVGGGGGGTPYTDEEGLRGPCKKVPLNNDSFIKDMYYHIDIMTT